MAIALYSDMSISKIQSSADVSVIIPAYQAKKTIGRALLSVANQTLTPREVIVVDDGSDDGTFETAQQMRKKLPNIKLRLLQQKNKGAGAARNLALKKAKGEFVAFLDSDDEWLTKKIEQSIKYIKKTKSTFIAHDLFVSESNGKVNGIECSKYFKKSTDVFSTLYRTGFIGSITVLANRESIVEIGGFDETLSAGQDFDLWLKLLKQPDTTFYLFEEKLARYHRNKMGITANTDQRLNCTIRIAIRYFPTLKAISSMAWFSFWYRITAVHFEAIRAYKNNGQIFKAITVLFKYPLSILSCSIKVCRISDSRNINQTEKE